MELVEGDTLAARIARRRIPMLHQGIGRIHSGTLSRTTFWMNGVSRHTGSFRLPGVRTRGEM
jgi:hypothetical protein